MKKVIAFAALVSIVVVSFVGCTNDHYTFSETRSFKDYNPLFDFFPQKPEEDQVLFYGDTSYNYWSNSADEYLALKFESDEEFLKAIAVINEHKTVCEHWEEANFFVNGYDCIFFQCSFSNGREENIKKYVSVHVSNTFYCIMWDLVMYSQSEKVIVYNLLRYDTRNFERWDYKAAYITEHMEVDLKSVAQKIYSSN